MTVTRNADAFPATGLAASVAQALSESQYTTWAALPTLIGAYDRELRRLPALDGLGGWVSVVWNNTTGKWQPDSVETLASYDLVTGNSATTSTLTIPTTNFTGGPFWAKTKLDITLRLTGTVNGCSAAPVNMSFGSMALIADTQQPTRRKSFRRSVDITAAAVQYCHSKLDNQFAEYSNETGAGLSGTVDTASNFALTGDVSTGWVNASSHVLSLQELVIQWRR